MNDNEVNKVIAEFMGNLNAVPVNINELSDRQKKIFLPYSHSLDALVPVWEKLRTNKNIRIDFWTSKNEYHCKLYPDIWVSSKTFQQAAAHATAKIILELKK